MEQIDKDLLKYQNCLDELRYRVDVIRDHLDGSKTTKYFITEVEFLCLQFRKILELIAFSSLVANKDEYLKAREKFATDWNARRIISELERVNSDFYPVPSRQIELPPINGRKNYELEPIKEGFLTKDELINVYEKCGGMMHAENPYGHKRDIYKLKNEFPIWLSKIMKLLDHHTITLVEGEIMFLGLMNAEDGKPHTYIFKAPSEGEK